RTSSVSCDESLCRGNCILMRLVRARDPVNPYLVWRDRKFAQRATFSRRSAPLRRAWSRRGSGESRPGKADFVSYRQSSIEIGSDWKETKNYFGRRASQI